MPCSISSIRSSLDPYKKKKLQPHECFCMKMCDHSTFITKKTLSSPEIHRETLSPAALLIFHFVHLVV